MDIEGLDWRAWPAARVGGTIQVVTANGGRGTAFDIQLSGNGRPLALPPTPASYWRNFALIDVDDETAVVGFIRRHGDPFTTTAPMDTAAWGLLAAAMEPAARLFRANPVDRNREFIWPGEEYLRVHSIAEQLIASPLFQQHCTFGPKVTSQGKGLLLQTDVNLVATSKTLAGLLLVSCLADLSDRPQLARCAYCGDFFRYTKPNARYCSASCRALTATAKAKGKTNG